MKGSSVFDVLMNELGQNADAAALLEESMSFDPGRIKKIPQRFLIIAYGFVRGLSLKELNAKLLEKGCATLYARSLYEASLIYAFQNGASYERWKELYAVAEAYAEKQGQGAAYFSGRSISFPELERYVQDNSDSAGHTLETARLTQVVERRIIEAAMGRLDFESFLIENYRAFSPVREKSRYYFCKYLYYNLSQRIETYIQAGQDEEDALYVLQPFKGIQTLKRKKHTPEETREFLRSTDLSCGGIFDAFNEMFFEYVSLDWMDVLGEAFGSLAEIPARDKKRLISSWRRQDPALAGLGDEEIIARKQEELDAREEELDEAYSLSGDSKGYQRNRSGENAIRNYIKGSLDLDRTTLICFLLFFGHDTVFPPDMEINEARLNTILSSCGFPILRPEDDFDCFVLGYLESDDPAEFLMEEVTNRALEEENFYLYRVYNLSTSYQKEIEKVAGNKK